MRTRTRHSPVTFKPQPYQYIAACPLILLSFSQPATLSTQSAQRRSSSPLVIGVTTSRNRQPALFSSGVSRGPVAPSSFDLTAVASRREGASEVEANLTRKLGRLGVQMPGTSSRRGSDAATILASGWAIQGLFLKRSAQWNPSRVYGKDMQLTNCSSSSHSLSRHFSASESHGD
ncbi:hypothetical protein FKP32DRAFT_290145 [Trametes sanguinea]|nr:hypothetical protein FKP32DRAFT_290145 [Trametes sanguinea]